MLPNFLVVGAARCGTTSLHYWLAQHPDICMSAIKEPNFFVFAPTPAGPRPCIGDDKRLITKSVPDRVRYERLFDVQGESALGEASPLYLYTRETPALVQALAPAMRAVAIVREPVDRAWSHFVYVNGDLDGPADAFAAAVERELPLGYEPYRTGTHFLRLSRYAEQLERWVTTFGRDQVLVLSYDDLVGRPAATLARVTEFLAVDSTFVFDTSIGYNPSGDDVSLLGRLDRRLRPAFPYVKRALPAGVAGRLAARRARARAQRREAASGRVGPDLPRELRARLDDYFAADLDWLANNASITF